MLGSMYADLQIVNLSFEGDFFDIGHLLAVQVFSEFDGSEVEFGQRLIIDLGWHMRPFHV